jgi:surface polysaccharide O-acyltransferase-like enzyme
MAVTYRDVSVRAQQRQEWVDNLRVLVIALVIIVHTATGYVTDIAGWYYDDELTTSDLWNSVVGAAAGLGAFFALGPLFVLAGWFSTRSVARHGPAGFARSRLIRLGVPLVLFVVIVQPLTDYIGNWWDEPDRTFGSYLRETEVGAMWFITALLCVSLVYALKEAVHPTNPERRPLRTALLVAVGLGIAVGSFVSWQFWTIDAEVFMNARFGEWAQGAGLFALGVIGANAGWIDELSATLTHRLGQLAAAGMVALFLLFGVSLAPDNDEKIALGIDVPTALFALLDGLIAVCFSLWFITWIRRRWATHGPLVAKAGRASYATYFIHPLVITLVMMSLAWVALVPELKFLLVAPLAVVACYAVGYALTRLPGISKVL